MEKGGGTSEIENIIGKLTITLKPEVIGIYPLIREVTAHFKMGNIVYVLRGLDPFRSVSDLSERVKKLNDKVKFCPFYFYHLWTGEETKNEDEALKKLDKIFAEMAGMYESVKG